MSAVIAPRELVTFAEVDHQMDALRDAEQAGKTRVLRQSLVDAAQWLADAEAALDSGDARKFNRAISGAMNELEGVGL